MMKFSRNRQSRSACYTLTTVAVLAITGIILALKYARDSNSSVRKVQDDNDEKHQEDFRETIRKRAALLSANGEARDPVRHTIKTHFPKIKPLPPQNYDPQF